MGKGVNDLLLARLPRERRKRIIAAKPAIRWRRIQRVEGGAIRFTVA